MRFIAATALALFAMTTAACADDGVTFAQGQRIQDALKAVGCIGGDMETETGGNIAFEVDDAVCDDDNQYDFKLDKDFNILTKSRS